MLFRMTRWLVAFLLLLAMPLAAAPAMAGSTPAAGAAAPEPFARGLLWEVRRPGTPKSYVFGTMHVADQRLSVLGPHVEKAFAASRVLVMEMAPNELASSRFAEAAELPADESLSKKLTGAEFAHLCEALAGRGMRAADVDRLKPWTALLLLTDGPTGTGTSIDVELYARARAGRRRVEDLDSVEEQIAVFDDLPAKTQHALLLVALQRRALLADDLEHSIAAYRKRDLGQLMRLARTFPAATEEQRSHLATLEKKVIHDRSVVMAHRAQSFLRRGYAFIAVGALHLYGRRGMLQALRDDGWSVKRID
jgi:uncharacterized protein YbaP (TraB family)